MTQACTGCEACANACPEHIVVIGAGGLPRIDFDRGECTFCGTCAEACQEPVFAQPLEKQQAFSHSARIGQRCLALLDVFCRACGDICPESAISFSPRLGDPDMPNIKGDLCTGCGACIGVCPAGAIGLETDLDDHR